jgi:CBS domain-containing protein
MADRHLEGIITEQDVVRRVVAVGRDPRCVTLAEAMTPQPDTLSPGDLAVNGLQMMEDGHYQHLPVLHRGRVVGLISRSDFIGTEATELEKQRHYWEMLG